MKHSQEGQSMVDNTEHQAIDTLPGGSSTSKKVFSKRTMLIWLTGIILAEIIASGITWPTVIQSFQSLFKASPTQSTIVRQAFFVSSGLLSDENSNQGNTDEFQINLQNVPAPQPGKSYYAWLLSDKNQNPPTSIFLGTLVVNQGKTFFSFNGTSQHTDLLATVSGFLITEEATNTTPANPSPDKRNWRFYAAFSTTPNPTDTINHFSLLDHLRHLLSQDPKLESVGLAGGLAIWLYRNTSKIFAAAGSARDAETQCASTPTSGACDLVHRALVCILDYLDGSQFVWKDVPTGQQVLIDPTIARVGLLEFDTVNQFPPGYLDHIMNHLQAIMVSPGVTTAQRTLAIRIAQALNNIQGWLEVVHTNAAQLVKMSNSQLATSASIFNDLFTYANDAFAGQFDPNTSIGKEGVVQIYYDVQSLADFNVISCTTINGQNTCA